MIFKEMLGLNIKCGTYNEPFVTWIVFFRVEEDIEIRGLDIKKHGEPAYPTAAYGHGWDTEGDFAMASKSLSII